MKRDIVLCCTLLVLFIVFFLSITQAMHIVTTFSGGTSFYAKEDVSTFYNFSINNTGSTAYENITEINVSLPTGFTFVSGSNGINISSGVSFSNSSSLLTWIASSPEIGIVQNNSKIFLWFNAIAATPGNYNFSITTLNASGPFNTTLVSIVVNDTTVPSSVVFNAPTSNSGANISTSYLSVNVSATDNGVLQSVTLYLFNSSQSQINSSTHGGSSLFVNFTGLAEGKYYLNATANDTFGNRNWSETRVIILDVTAPTITLGTSNITSSSVNLTITLSDSLSGITRSCNVDQVGAKVEGTGITQRLSDSGLTCNSKNNYILTCADAAGNTRTQNVTLTTSSCTAGQNAGSPSGVWKATYAANDSQGITGYTKELSVSEAVKIKVGNEDHYVGIISVSGLSVTINISSTPQQAIFIVGQTKRFEVTGDLFYDLNVTLNSVNAGKVNVSVFAVHEPIPAQTGGATTGAGSNAVSSLSNASLNKSLNATGGNVQSLGTASWITLIAVITLVIIIVAFLLYSSLRKSQRERDGNW